MIQQKRRITKKSMFFFWAPCSSDSVVYFVTWLKTEIVHRINRCVVGGAAIFIWQTGSSRDPLHPVSRPCPLIKREAQCRSGRKKALRWIDVMPCTVCPSVCLCVLTLCPYNGLLHRKGCLDSGANLTLLRIRHCLHCVIIYRVFMSLYY